MSNDVKIREFRDAVETKREKLGGKPRLGYVTNALLDLNGVKMNLNTLNEAECVAVVSSLLVASSFNDQANERLGTAVAIKLGDFTIDQWIEDIKSRVGLLVWQRKKKTLDAMEKQLQGLRSEDAKTADAINAIAAQLAE